MDRGIVVASTHHIEWLLPWWWRHFRLHNALPVAFLDLGLSEACKAWCKERGELIPVRVPELDLRKERVEPSLAKKWEETHGDGIWDVRLKWFMKPFAFRQTPFERTIWLDLDCEVRASLDFMFAFCENQGGIALAREPELVQYMFGCLEFIRPGEIIYNSGVVVYRRDAPILAEWEEEVAARAHLYLGDQDALSRLLFLKQSHVEELGQKYNWTRGLGENPEALIIHWSGQKGKMKIRKEMDALAKMGVRFDGC